ncbi:MAG: glutamine--tRNA ligase, partial [Oscillospiraceae bacterium]|nr:glutamine--tRNA ligase [Oscillospiraceae bacterium]
RSIRNFCERIGVSKAYNTVDYGFLEHCIREDLNENAMRMMVVLRPIKLVIDNYPEGQTETFDAQNNPADENSGTHKVTFSRELYIEREDFLAEPVKGYFRMFPGNEVRLKYAYYVTCKSFETDENGNVTVIHAEYDPESRGGDTPDKRKVKGTIHWVSAHDAVDAEVRLYENLFNAENPGEFPEGGAFTDNINPDSLEILSGCKCESAIKDGLGDGHYQFLRNGYFCLDTKLSTEEKLVFNRTVSLKDSWAKKK